MEGFSCLLLFLVLHIDIPLSQQHLLKTISSWLNYLGTLSKINGPSCVGLFCPTHLYVCPDTDLYFIDYCNFTV